MKKLIATLALGAMATSAHAIILDISTIADSGIEFDGSGSFSFFSPGFSDANFEVDNTDGAGDAQNLMGQITGSWDIDSTVGSTSTVTGGVGTFKIWDSMDMSNAFTADVDFHMIGVVLDGGVINGAMNLTNFAYVGLNDDLNALLAAGAASISLSFEVADGPDDLTLSFLSSTNVESTFSGDVVSDTPRVPDTGVTMAMLGLGLLALGGARFRSRR